MQLPVAIRPSGDFENQTRMLSNWEMRGEPNAIGLIRTAAIQFQLGSILGRHTLLDAGKREALGGSIKTIGASRKMTVGDIGPTVPIIAPFEERLAG